MDMSARQDQRSSVADEVADDRFVLTLERGAALVRSAIEVSASQDPSRARYLIESMMQQLDHILQDVIKDLQKAS